MTDAERDHIILATLECARECFEASPCHTFSREQVVAVLRALGQEMTSEEAATAFRIAQTPGGPEALLAFLADSEAEARKPS